MSLFLTNTQFVIDFPNPCLTHHPFINGENLSVISRLNTYTTPDGSKVDPVTSNCVNISGPEASFTTKN